VVVEYRAGDRPFIFAGGFGMSKKDDDGQRPPFFAAGAFDVVAIAASAGGLNPLGLVVSGLPELEIGLPVDRLAPPLRAALAGGSPRQILLNAVDRRGKSFKCRITITPTITSGREPRGAVLVMEED